MRLTLLHRPPVELLVLLVLIEVEAAHGRRKGGEKRRAGRRRRRACRRRVRLQLHAVAVETHVRRRVDVVPEAGCGHGGRPGKFGGGEGAGLGERGAQAGTKGGEGGRGRVSTRGLGALLLHWAWPDEKDLTRGGVTWGEEESTKRGRLRAIERGGPRPKASSTARLDPASSRVTSSSCAFCVERPARSASQPRSHAKALRQWDPRPRPQHAERALSAHCTDPLPVSLQTALDRFKP